MNPNIYNEVYCSKEIGVHRRLRVSQISRKDDIVKLYSSTSFCSLWALHGCMQTFQILQLWLSQEGILIESTCIWSKEDTYTF